MFYIKFSKCVDSTQNYFWTAILQVFAMYLNIHKETFIHVNQNLRLYPDRFRYQG
jgi:hypothetical protein